MTTTQLIEKYGLWLQTRNGVEGFSVVGKTTPQEIAELKAAKPAIVAELKRRQAVVEAETRIRVAKNGGHVSCPHCGTYCGGECAASMRRGR